MPDDYAVRLWALRPDDEKFDEVFRLAFGRAMTAEERRYFHVSSVAVDAENSNLKSKAAAAGSCRGKRRRQKRPS